MQNYNEQLVQAGIIPLAGQWVKKAPFDRGAEIEIRPIYEACDLGGGLTPELEERGRKLREKIAARK